MNFAITEEQVQLRSMVRQFLEEKSPEAAVRELMETERGFDPAVWSEMAQLGLQGLLVPEELGGQGLGHPDLALVLEEMGRSLLCAPYLSTAVLAVETLLGAGDREAQSDLLPRVASGEITAVVALAEGGGGLADSDVQALARRDGEVWKITGTKLYVLDGHTADVVLVAARTPAGVSLFRVGGSASGLHRSALDVMDTTRKQARLDFRDAEATLVGEEGAGWRVLSRALDRAAVALAAEQVGGAQRCLDMSVQYAGERVQFGSPIGSFQAIKHKCADVLLEVESARSAARYAAWCASELEEELPTAASLAKAYCSDAYVAAASENIQIHGGIGFTWEHPAHLYFKRAKSSALLFGDPSHHRERLAQQIERAAPAA